jgi:hypothetical protein
VSGIVGALAVEFLPQLIQAAATSGIAQEIVSGAAAELGVLQARGVVSVAAETALAATIEQAAADEAKNPT